MCWHTETGHASGSACFLFGCSLIAGLAWRVAYLEKNQAVGFPRFIAFSLLIALLSLRYIESVDSGQNAGLNLYSYDVWWPPLAIWVAVCLVSTMLGALNLTSGWFLQKDREIDAGYLGGIAIAISILASIAIFQRSDIFDDSVKYWILVLYVTAPAAMWAMCYLALQALDEGRTADGGISKRRTIYAILGAIVAVVLALAFVTSTLDGNGATALLSAGIWAVPIVASLVFLAIRSGTIREYMGTHLPRAPIGFQIGSVD